MAFVSSRLCLSSHEKCGAKGASFMCTVVFLLSVDKLPVALTGR